MAKRQKKTSIAPHRIAAIQADATTHSLTLTFGNGEDVRVDLSGLISGDPNFECLGQDDALFASARPIDWGHGVEWANGLDVTANFLRQIAEAQSLRPDAEEIVAFQKTHGLTIDQMARVLGYGKTQIKNFRNRKSPIPMAVTMALKSMDANIGVLYGRLAATDMNAQGESGAPTENRTPVSRMKILRPNH